jgi:DNA-binding NtrC family response regulator
MATQNSTRVLILDDERVIADTLCIVLKHHGYRAYGAYNHHSAVTIAREFRPHVFTGFNNLDDKNGCETALEVLSFLPRCRVMICSGSPAAADALNDYRRRGYNFETLAKPVHPQDLLAVVGPREAEE